MTILEVVADLRSKPKPYAGIMPHSTYFTTLAAIEDGTAKESTREDFFRKLGYRGSFNEWQAMAVAG